MGLLSRTGELVSSQEIPSGIIAATLTGKEDYLVSVTGDKKVNVWSIGVTGKLDLSSSR